jgi:Ca2+-binding RTX toxin-like protein
VQTNSTAADTIDVAQWLMQLYALTPTGLASATIPGSTSTSFGYQFSGGSILFTGAFTGNDAATGSGTLTQAEIHLDAYAAITITVSNLNISLLDLQAAAASGDALSALQSLFFSGTFSFTGGDGNETLVAFGTSATMDGGNGADILTGTSGNDEIMGGAGNDSLTGDAGADILDGGVGADVMTGGLGSDSYYIDNIADTIVEAAELGANDLVSGIISFTNFTNVEVAVLEGEDAINLTGHSGAEQLAGNLAANIIRGMGGNDLLAGFEGGDRLDGGAGLDAMHGGTGNDTYVIDAVGDTLNELIAQGFDTAESAVLSINLLNYTSIENALLTGSLALNLVGDNRNNVLTGNSAANNIQGNLGNDTLEGGAARDTMSGGGGNDLYITIGGDTLSEAAGGGTDTVQSTVNFTLANNFENLVLAGTAQTGRGNTAFNELTGNASANRLFGLGGNDIISGGSGNDLLDGGAGRETLTGGIGNDVFDFNATSESGTTATTRDVITDFVHLSDDINLATIDASTQRIGNNAFRFIGTQSFQNRAGDVRFEQVDNAGTVNDHTIVQGDVNGDNTADFTIELTGLITLTSADFVL